MNLNRVAGEYGRNKPHPSATHPRVMLEDHVEFNKLPSAPSLIDWCSKVKSWPLYLNDQLGDCTCAEVGHAIQAFTAYSGTEIDIPESAVLSLYEYMGYAPGNPSTDNGAVIQDVLKAMTTVGCGGHTYKVFARLSDIHNMGRVYQALDLFGSVYLGINCPDSAASQFKSHQTWTYVPGSSVEGGHAIALQRKNEDETLDVITWGAVQRMDQSFWDNYVEEAWVVITEDWFNQKSQDTPTGLNLNSLMEDFSSLNN
jgi:hypothetical protein